MMLWNGPGGLRDEPPGASCDGDCGTCPQGDCDERGAECAAPENCENCPARGWCNEDKTNDEESEECT